MSYKEPGRYSTKEKDANTKMTEMLELVNQEFKGVIIKMLQGAIMDTFETNRKVGVNTYERRVEQQKQLLEIFFKHVWEEEILSYN